MTHISRRYNGYVQHPIYPQKSFGIIATEIIIRRIAEQDQRTIHLAALIARKQLGIKKEGSSIPQVAHVGIGQQRVFVIKVKTAFWRTGKNPSYRAEHDQDIGSIPVPQSPLSAHQKTGETTVQVRADPKPSAQRAFRCARCAPRRACQRNRGYASARLAGCPLHILLMDRQTTRK